MLNAINRMFVGFVKITNEFEKQLAMYLEQKDTFIYLENMDCESFQICISPDVMSKKQVNFYYHEHMKGVEVNYFYHLDKLYSKEFTTVLEALEDIKKFFSKEEIQ